MKAAESEQGIDRSEVRWFSSKSLVGFDERNKRRIGGLLGEGGTVWEMAATSLHSDVLLDSEECHERASHCASIYEDSLVGKLCERQRY